MLFVNNATRTWLYRKSLKFGNGVWNIEIGLSVAENKVRKALLFALRHQRMA